MIRRNSPAYLITKGLGYCCPWFFFHSFSKKPATLLATRLGCGLTALKELRRNPGECCSDPLHCSKRWLQERGLWKEPTPPSS